VKFPTNLDLSKLRAEGAENQGQYELVSVITHIGRSADSGHYISWTKDSDHGFWWKYDDDKVSLVTEEEIKKLDGGGDWHTAYLCIYKINNNGTTIN
jgi:ubiquitin carboxyl-terminal hydrolase 14